MKKQTILSLALLSGLLFTAGESFAAQGKVDTGNLNRWGPGAGKIFASDEKGKDDAKLEAEEVKGQRPETTKPIDPSTGKPPNTKTSL